MSSLLEIKGNAEAPVWHFEEIIQPCTGKFSALVFFHIKNGQQLDLTDTDTYSEYEFVVHALRSSTNTTTWMFADFLIQWPGSQLMSLGTRVPLSSIYMVNATMELTGQSTYYNTQDLVTWLKQWIMYTWVINLDVINILWKWDVIPQKAVYLSNQRPLCDSIPNIKNTWL